MVSPSMASTCLPSSSNWILVIPPLPSRVFRKSGNRFCDKNTCKTLDVSIFSRQTASHFAGKCSWPELIREIFNDCRQRIRGRLAQTADRCIPHRLAQFVEQLAVPDRFLHQQRRLLGADTARRALTAAFVLE